MIARLLLGHLTREEADRIETGAAMFGTVVLGFVLIVASARFLGAPL